MTDQHTARARRDRRMRGPARLLATMLLLGLAGLAALWADMAKAASSAEFSSAGLTARLISVQDGVPEGGATLTAGLALKLGEGWKTYWRTPGEVGLPPEVDWSGSTNLATATRYWPAPERFSAFGIENFGYSKEVVLPFQLDLETPGQATTLVARVNLLVCSEVCVPETFELTLALPPGNGIDQDAAREVGRYLNRVPEPAADQVNTTAEAALSADGRMLTIAARTETPLNSPDMFPETASNAAFGKPDIRLGEGGTRLWAEIPLLYDDAPEDGFREITVTVTDGTAKAFELRPRMVTVAPEPPFAVTTAGPGLSELIWIVLIAFLGGLVLNVMPCVLPVLSIKLSSVMRHDPQDRAGMRTGILASGLGVMTFMWVLAASLYLLRLAGASVGWGVQFQNPFFIALMVLIMALFSANLFGVFEISLPAGLQTRLARAGGGKGHSGDFLTGVFAAIMATPCSAPFLGTAVAFALAGRGVDIFLVFTSLGLGLALPYFLVALRPRILLALPRPGKWMVVVKTLIGALLLATSLWLLWVLEGVAGRPAALAVTVLALALVAVVALPGPMRRLRWSAVALLAVLAVGAVPQVLATETATPRETAKLDWVSFEQTEIARRVSRGESVFVDVTADWCLTCKANKALVIEREPVLSALREPGVTPMQADWTRPDPKIGRYLESFGRYGIPFNAVFGPAAPEGIILPEILSSDEVLEALARAAGSKPDLTLLQK